MKRILTVAAAVTAFAAIGAAPAPASQPAPAQPASAYAAKEDAGHPICIAVVREWPYQVNLYGHFEITEPLNNPPNGHSYSNVGEVNFGISGPVGVDRQPPHPGRGRAHAPGQAGPGQDQTTATRRGHRRHARSRAGIG